ncbi:hypothetical protein DCAR_0416873 [Daucus carota subsp. sativus]|uniref:BAT2 N-terminal domain-containing protein n=1 Tax=Daucus carota subsp. sativus TaxID=79200 RepID=A0AAF1AY92_DAUCS|nr:hypothetical protein DCAR_0416873 [Daucus carota subsp. sativus]
MASHGSGANKFVSVNLNKSFGQSSSYNFNRATHFNNGSYGQVVSSRVRTGGSGGAGSGAGGSGEGMVVLGRPRSSQKVAPKLSVPPPLNLPSLRKEHEKFDLGGSGSGLAAGNGSGSRPNASGGGWTKPGAVTLQEKDDGLVGDHVDQSVQGMDGAVKGSNSYVPPSARISGVGGGSGQSSVQPAEKAMVLRGEDFPSLKAALPITSGPSQKQRDNVSHKQKQDVNEESSNEQYRGYNDLHSSVDMRPQGQYSYSANSNASIATGGQGRRTGGYANISNRTHEDYPLPLVRLNPRSDWADDERDTGHVDTDWGRDSGPTRTDAYWDRDFDIPRANVLPKKPPSSIYDNQVLRVDDFDKGRSSEVRKVDPYQRSMRPPAHEGNNWRTTPLQNVGLNKHEVSTSVNASSQPMGLSRDNWRENKYVPPRLGQEGRQQWNHMVESSSQRSEQKDRFGAEQIIEYRGDAPQNETVSKFPISSGSKELSVNDPILNFNRQKLHVPKNDRPYSEDPLVKNFGSSSFGEMDPFSGGGVGVFKRKKEVINQAEVHDPVRESFEAELERVQKMQEMERQRIIEEQERVMEQARKEEEERQRMIREDEERRRRLEEEAQEAVWRAEQERLEVIRRAEEQRIAREEEKRRIFDEEERRKHAAKQKLLELEAKIAQRRVEAQKSDCTFAEFQNEKTSSGTKEKDMSADADLDDWEDSERMVERITTSASSESSAQNRPFVSSSRLPPLVKSSSGFLERGKTVNPWRKDVFENANSSSLTLQDQDNAHLSPRRDALVGERSFLRKDFYGGTGFPNAYSVGLQEDPLGEYTHTKENRWNLHKDGDLFSKSSRGIGPESYKNVSEINEDAAWGQAYDRGNPYSAYPERLYPNAEADELYSYGRSRYSMKQPRVLPPPSIKSSYRSENEHPGPSSTLGVDTPYSYIARSESAPQTGSFDESDESGDSPAMPVSAEEKVVPLSETDSIVMNKSAEDIVVTVSSSMTAGEDDEWTLNKNEKLQEQEVYDEDGYQEEDEVHEVDEENIDLTSEFENMHLNEKDSSDMMDNLVLGFDEGVEVKLSNDEFDRNVNSEGNNCEISEVSTGIVDDQESAEGKQGDPGKVHPVDCFSRTDTEIASGRIDRPEQSTQGMVMQPINDPPVSVICDLLNVENTFSSGLSSLSTASSLVDTASQFACSQPIMSVASSSPKPADLPVKLQFGLFTGPSLIPSPVPAIQIGSIQMPLHLHLPLDPSINHLHTSQPPLFQFGQLGYTTPVSQGILPLPPQSMSLLQPSVHHHYNVNLNSGGSLPNKFNEHTQTQHLVNDKVSSLSKALDLSDNNGPGVLSSFPVGGSADGNRTGFEVQQAVNNNYPINSVSQAEDKVVSDSATENGGQLNGGGPQGRLRSTGKFVSCEKGNTSKGERPLIGHKEKKLPYPVRNYGGRSFSQENSYSDSRGFQRRPRWVVQRTEFRVRQTSSGFPSKNSGLDDKLNLNGTGAEVSTGSGYKRGTMTPKSLKRVVDSESSNSGPISPQEVDSDNKVAKERAKDALPKRQGNSFSREENMKMNISKEDVDVPSQSGVVHVFKQSGIEAPSDEDDFIEVRSKRQMLNDRREQREKEIKAKSRVTKLSRKPRSSSQSIMVLTSSNKNCASLGGETSNNTQSGSTSEKEVLIGFAPIASQQLAPIGTPTLNSDFGADFRSHTKSLQAAAVPAVAGGGKDIGQDLIYENKNKVLDTVQTPLGSWGNEPMSQQVMALTQNQLDDAMKPASFETHVTSIGGCTTSETVLASSSSLTKDKPMTSSANPISSLLAGERIQFGAVTSPTVLPPSISCVTSLGIGAPGSFLSNIKMSQNISREQSSSPLLLERDNSHHESCGKLENSEDKAEASASAAAVTAISKDKTAVNGLSCVSNADAKNIGNDQQSGIQSRSEESLSVSLPADLSVETPPISSWPPLPSPQNSSSQMLSHFHVPPPSNFPYYEMNPMLGGPIFAFSPIEESGGSHSQPQKNPVSGPGPVGSWQQCHPTMDSFYGPPAGFNGPFINPPGAMPGVQAPPQMLVYNHYARVGQFGQVGLSFMGTTYIPSGKQPDWKHNPTSSGLGISEGSMNNINMISAQHNPPNMPTPIPHLAPGPSILPLPMASPMAMFDVSPFQSAPDMSVQGRWSHVPSSPLPMVPMTLPLQQQTEGISASNFSHGHPIEQFRANRFSESQTSAPSDSNHAFPVVADAGHSLSPDKLGSEGTSSRISAGTSTNVVTHQSSTGSVTSETGKREAVQNGSNNTSSGLSINSFKPQHSQQKNLSSQQYSNTTGYGYQRGGASQRHSSTSDWSHRRMGFNGKNSLGPDKALPNSKVRQIYVAKQTKGSSTTD